MFEYRYPFFDSDLDPLTFLFLNSSRPLYVLLIIYNYSKYNLTSANARNII
jgi:hypothetical protein